MDEREKDPLRELGERLEKARGAAKQPGANESLYPSTGSALAFGWRIGIELIGALIVATFIGWAIDRWLGTRPWGLVVFFFLGMAAGMLNVYRAVTGLGRAAGFKRNGQAGPSSASPPATWDDDED